MRFNYRGPNNELFTEVKVNSINRKVTVINHTDDFIDRAFGVKEYVTYEDVMKFFESRTFPKDRANIEEILKEMGIKEYDPYKMCKYTEGRMAEDNNWIEFL